VFGLKQCSGDCPGVLVPDAVSAAQARPEARDVCRPPSLGSRLIQTDRASGLDNAVKCAADGKVIRLQILPQVEKRR